MSKVKNRTTSGRASRGEGDAPQSSPAKAQKTEAERLHAKVASAHAMVEGALSRSVQVGAPLQLVEAVRECARALVALRSQTTELVASGWEPVKRKALKELAAGDGITIAEKYRGSYTFIPGLVDGTDDLVADVVERDSKGRARRVLVKSRGDENGMDSVGEPVRVYGYVPLAHVERAAQKAAQKAA